MLIKVSYMAEGLDAANDVAEDYAKRYPVQGYSTRTKVVPDTTLPAPYTHRIDCDRAHSCD